MKKILLVDDSVTIQEIISNYFRSRSSFQVITAEDGEIALDQIRNAPPDLIILDIILPKINGLALLRDIRRMGNAGNIPVILISGQMFDDAIKNEGFELGAVDFLEKPIDMSYLLEKVNSILSVEES